MIDNVRDYYIEEDTIFDGKYILFAFSPPLIRIDEQAIVKYAKGIDSLMKAANKKVRDLTQTANSSATRQLTEAVRTGVEVTAQNVSPSSVHPAIVMLTISRAIFVFQLGVMKFKFSPPWILAMATDYQTMGGWLGVWVGSPEFSLLFS